MHKGKALSKWREKFPAGEVSRQEKRAKTQRGNSSERSRRAKLQLLESWKRGWVLLCCAFYSWCGSVYWKIYFSCTLQRLKVCKYFFENLTRVMKYLFG